MAEDKDRQVVTTSLWLASMESPYLLKSKPARNACSDPGLQAATSKDSKYIETDGRRVQPGNCRLDVGENSKP